MTTHLIQGEGASRSRLKQWAVRHPLAAFLLALFTFIGRGGRLARKQKWTAPPNALLLVVGANGRLCYQSPKEH